jgi:hypothetical protein
MLEPFIVSINENAEDNSPPGELIIIFISFGLLLLIRFLSRINLSARPQDSGVNSLLKRK